MTKQLDISEKPMTPYLKQLLEDVRVGFENLDKDLKTLKEKVDAFYKQAEYENFTPFEIREKIEAAIPISQPHLRKLLPKEAKRGYALSDIEKTEDIFKDWYRSSERYESINTTSKPYDYDPNTVTITTKHDVIDPYEETKERIDDLIKETQDKQLKPITDKLSDLGYDLDPEDLQIQINDLTTQLENERSERIRISQLLDKEREKNKDPNFTPASELVKPTTTNPDDDTSPVLRSVYKKTIGELNSRILELKDKLIVKTFKQTLELEGQRIVVNVRATNLQSIEIDERESRRLNS